LRLRGKDVKNKTKSLDMRSNKYFAVFFFVLFIYGKTTAQTAATMNTSVEPKIEQILKQMSLEEKVGQMAQVAIDVIGKVDYSKQTFTIDPEKLNDVVVNFKLGSILNTPPGILLTAQQWNQVMNDIQKAAQKTRLKIPVLYGLDDIHGVNYAAGTTLFPQQIGQAATWNRQLAYDAGVITAYEGRAVGVPWTFSPVVDLGTNPQWPRIWEGYGEDPYLAGELGAQFTKGVQDPLGSKEKLVVSLKHYMAYSDPKSGHDRTDAWIPEHYLREYHLPAFAAGVRAGARTVMVNSALINGIPGHINKHVLTDILKNELKFTGFIVTDWQDIENIYRRDKVAKTMKEAVMLAINAGIDMSMIPYDYKQFCTDLIALAKERKVPMSRIDDAVRRILRVKYELDLFNTPTTSFSSYPKFASAEFQRAAYNTAAESITLLKNTNKVLPLSKAAKILVTGPNANSMRCLNGGWTYTWQGDRADEFGQQYNTILEAVTNKFGKQNVTYVQGVAYKERAAYFQDSIINLDAVVQAAASADYILLCIGENSYTETPGNLEDLSLSDNQIALANALSKTGKPLIFVLTEGRPRIISKIEPDADAILHAYLPGNYGADALADILNGDVNPSGKLPLTYPRYTNSLVGYIHKVSEGEGNPQGGEFKPQYAFGFGLSYTTFSYSNLSVNKTSFGPNETATITLTVRNTGNRDGKEVVQLFISDLQASFTPDVKRLRGFEKVDLKAGASKTVSFKIPMKQLAFVNPGNKLQLEEGDFKVQVADQSATFKVTSSIVF
jgi:beta-glucosidase